jgi:amino acid transporter
VTTSAPGRPLPPYIVAGFAVACVGGPLALVALYGPDAVGGPAIGSAGLVSLIGAIGFLPVLYVWWRYSQRIASGGGLYEFVRQSAGLGPARLHGVIWTVSYFLYLPFTITGLVFDVLPVAYPGVTGHRAAVQLGIAVAIVALVVLADRLAIGLLAVLAVVQVIVLLAYAGVLLDGAGLTSKSFAANSSGTQLPRGSANVALLFLCASLPLYLGGEAVGGARTIRRSVVGAVALTAVLLVIGMVGYAALSGSAVATLAAPGYTLASVYRGQSFAKLVLIVAAASVLSIIVAEYVALTRLLNAMTGLAVRRLAVIIGALFLIAEAISLIDPDTIYDHALTVSLAALYLSQIVVFAVYPMWRRRTATLSIVDVAASAAGTALMIFGLYVVISQAGS